MAENENKEATVSQYDTKSVEQNEEMQTGILTEMQKMTKKTLMYQRITTGLVLVFVIAILCVVPSLLKTLEAVRTTLDGVNEVVEQANTALEEANTAITQAEQTMKDLSSFVETAGGDLETVVSSIESVDFDSLNNAIKNLDATVKPLADFFRKF
ncbi:MAG: hypothetical protein IK123_00115 [Lachnospiraceae bacterium]|nr:hypothetical protein [Lachnospiraceae bacterium]